MACWRGSIFYLFSLSLSLSSSLCLSLLISPSLSSFLPLSPHFSLSLLLPLLSPSLVSLSFSLSLSSSPPFSPLSFSTHTLSLSSLLPLSPFPLSHLLSAPLDPPRAVISAFPSDRTASTATRPPKHITVCAMVIPCCCAKDGKSYFILFSTCEKKVSGQARITHMTLHHRHSHPPLA